MPLSRFQLDLGGVFEARSDLCAATETFLYSAEFAAHSGAAFGEGNAVAVEGCTPPPRVGVRIARMKSGRPRVKVAVTAAADGPALARVDVSLPAAFEVRRAKRVRTTGGTAKLAGDGELALALPAGTRAVTAKLRKGALRVGRRLRRAKPPRRQDVLVVVRDADGVRPPVALKVRPRRGA